MRLSRQDVRLAGRVFVRHPGFAITAVLSLALAIALNTTMYSEIDAIVNPVLEIRHPENLFWLTFYGDMQQRLSNAQRTDLITSGMRTYDAVTYEGGSFSTGTVEWQNRFAQIHVLWVAPNFLDVFGVRPLRGRGFLPSDVTAEAAPILISDRLAGTLSPDAPFPIGTSVFFDGARHPVIGILSRGSVVPGYQRPDVFQLPPASAMRASVPNIIRIRPGATVAQAVAEFQVLSSRVAAMVGEDPKNNRYDLKRVTDSQFHPQRFHYELFAAVFAVLLVACANLANLQLARGIGRSRELALRTALGATRRDIIAQLLTESALLAAAGLFLGCLLTFWGVHLLDSRVPPSVSDYVISPQISWRVFGFAMIAALLCVFLVGLLPAISVSRVDPNELLKSGAGTGANKKNRRRYGMMVVAELGLSLALLSGAALVVRTAAQVHSIDPGFDVKPVVVAGSYLRGDRDTVLNAAAYSSSLISRIRGVPDVADVAVEVPRTTIGHMVTANERDGTPRELASPMFGYKVVTPSYFRTMGLPILKGRGFAEGVATVAEVIVDQHTARGLWPGVDPVGQEIKLGAYKSDAPWLRVVGVVPEIKEYRQLVMYGWTERASRIGDVYVVQTAGDSINVSSRGGTGIRILVRAKSRPEWLPITLQRFLPRGGLVRYADAQSMEEEMGMLRERERHDFVAALFVTFAVLGVALAALGIFAIVNHSIAERRRELGVRLALGASARDILHAVLREGNAIGLAGVALGLLFTRFTAGWLQAFIFEDDQYNAPMFAAMAAILFVVAVLAALWPALRATHIDPVESLRSE
jgi:putative ABC transport system permease protein